MDDETVAWFKRVVVQQFGRCVDPFWSVIEQNLFSHPLALNEQRVVVEVFEALGRPDLHRFAIGVAEMARFERLQMCASALVTVGLSGPSSNRRARSRLAGVALSLLHHPDPQIGEQAWAALVKSRLTFAHDPLRLHFATSRQESVLSERAKGLLHNGWLSRDLVAAWPVVSAFDRWATREQAVECRMRHTSRWLRDAFPGSGLVDVKENPAEWKAKIWRRDFEVVRYFDVIAHVLRHAGDSVIDAFDTDSQLLDRQQALLQHVMEAFAPEDPKSPLNQGLMPERAVHEQVVTLLNDKRNCSDAIEPGTPLYVLLNQARTILDVVSVAVHTSMRPARHLSLQNATDHWAIDVREQFAARVDSASISATNVLTPA
jgi:hypothetical protein